MIKKLFKHFIVITFLCMASTIVYADLPPDPGGGPGGGDLPVGGSSPIGGGLIITMTLAAIYGSRKIIAFREKI